MSPPSADGGTGGPCCSRRGARLRPPRGDAVPQHSLPTSGCCGSQSQQRPRAVPAAGACASRRHIPPGHPAHRSHPIPLPVPSPAHLLVPATISHSRRRLAGGQRGWIYCGSSAYSRCPRAAGRAGHASSRRPPAGASSPRRGWAVPRVCPASTGRAAPRHRGRAPAALGAAAPARSRRRWWGRMSPGPGGARAGRAGPRWVRCSRCHTESGRWTGIPKGRRHTGTGFSISWAVTSGQSRAGAIGSTAAGSSENPF